MAELLGTLAGLTDAAAPTLEMTGVDGLVVPDDPEGE